MSNRKTLTTLAALIGLVGVAFAAAPFISSLSPTHVAKEASTMRVSIASIPEQGALEVDWSGWKVFLVRAPEPKAYLMPYWDGAYRLPDPTWERAIMPCDTIITGPDGLTCVDQELLESWSGVQRVGWSLEGVGTLQWMPYLRLAPYRVDRGDIVLSPEFR